jgi:hypothetical protein
MCFTVNCIYVTCVAVQTTDYTFSSASLTNTVLFIEHCSDNVFVPTFLLSYVICQITILNYVVYPQTSHVAGTCPRLKRFTMHVYPAS